MRRTAEIFTRLNELELGLCFLLMSAILGCFQLDCGSSVLRMSRGLLGGLLLFSRLFQDPIDWVARFESVVVGD